MIIYIEQEDIFDIKGVTSYAHGCNCLGSMGRGVAVQFRNKFPQMYVEYHRMCRNKLFHPGDVYDYDYGDGHIYNMATQYDYCPPGELAKLEYIEVATRKMMKLATAAGVKSIALPTIGAGLGGLKWDDVKAVMEKIASDCPDVNLFIVLNYKQKD